MLNATIKALLVAAVAALLLVSLRRGPWTAPGRRPRKRHVVARVICAVLGTFILVATAVCTFQDVRACYAPRVAAQSLTVRAPAMDAPPLEAGGSSERPQMESARLLVHFVAAEVSREQLRPIYIKEHDVRWPEESSHTQEGHADIDGVAVDYGFSFEGVRGRGAVANKPSVFEPWGSMHVSYRRRNGRGSRSGGFSGLGVIDGGLLDHAVGSRPGRPFSIVQRQPRGEIRAFFIVTRVAPDDPLEAAPAAEFLKSCKETMVAMATPTLEWAAEREQLQPDIPAPGIALAAHLGSASVLLLAAALLFTQLFARRSLALAGMLTAAILYVAALDRAVLAAHLSRMRDPQSSAQTRLIARAQASRTFFYRETARAALAAAEPDQSGL